jgi:hypothetical protein
MYYEINKISSLTAEEYVYTRATLHAMDNRKFRCEDCLSQFAGHQAEKEMLEKAQALNVCKDVIDTPRFVIGKQQDLKFYTCIGNFYRHEIAQMFRWFLQYEQGVMPFQGAFSDQPNKIIEIFSVMEEYRNDKLDEIKRTEKRKSRMKKGHGR